MHHIDDDAQAMKNCAWCGGRAFYWRSAVVAGNPGETGRVAGAAALRQPAWTCLSCGYIEPHERRSRPATVDSLRSPRA